MEIIKKVIILFIVIFLLISVFHVVYNAVEIAKLPSINWSRDIFIQKTFFNRKSLVSIDDDKVLLVYPYKKEEGKVGIKVFNEKVEQIKEEIVDIKELNFNRVKADEIFVDKNKIFWRDNSLNKVYIGMFIDEYKKIKMLNVFDNIKAFNVYSDEDNNFLTMVDEEDNIFITKMNGQSKKTIEGPKAIKDIETVRFFEDDSKLFLQFVHVNNTSGFKEIMISEYSDENWTKPKKMNEVNEVKIRIKDISIYGDNKNIYSLTTIQGNDKSRFTYLVDVYEKESHKSYETLKLDHGMKFGIDYFSSIPSITGAKDSGIEIVTTAPTKIDLYSRNASNVIKMLVNEQGIQNAELLTKTKSWSNRPSYTSGKYEYVFWNESEEGEYFLVKGATTEKSVVEFTSKKSSKDIKEAIGEEVPVIASYNFLLDFGGRFLTIMPALAWLLFTFIYNERLPDKRNMMLMIGIAIYYVFQLLTIKNFYNPYNQLFMPEILKFSGAKVIIPTIFTAIGWYAAGLYQREKEVEEVYKVYFTFLIFSYILMNHLYSAYLFR